MDRIRWRQITSRPFLRPEKFNIWNQWNPNSVRFGVGEWRKRHEFDVGSFHGTAYGDLFLFLHRSGYISSFVRSCSAWSLPKRRWNRKECDWKGKCPLSSMESLVPPVNAEPEIWRSSLGPDWSHHIMVVHVWQRWPPDTFHWVHVGRGNCGVPLRILFFYIRI